MLLPDQNQMTSGKHIVPEQWPFTHSRPYTLGSRQQHENRCSLTAIHATGSVGLHFDLEIESAHRSSMTGKSKLPDVFSQHPQVMSGALVFEGTRIAVQTFFDHIDHGGTLEQFLD